MVTTESRLTSLPGKMPVVKSDDKPIDWSNKHLIVTLKEAGIRSRNTIAPRYMRTDRVRAVLFIFKGGARSPATTILVT